MSEQLHEGDSAAETADATIRSAFWTGLILGFVLLFALDALANRIAGLLDDFEVAGDAFPIVGALVATFLDASIIMVIVRRDAPVTASFGFLRSVLLLGCAVLLTDPAARILLHLLSPDFSTSETAFLLRTALVLVAFGGLVLFMMRKRFELFPTDDDKPDSAPPPTV